MPESVRILQFSDTGTELHEQFFVKLPVLVLCRQFFQYLRQPAEHPAVAASPENLPAVGLALVKIPPVAIEKILFLVEKVVIRSFVFAVHEFDILFITRQDV